MAPEERLNDALAAAQRHVDAEMASSVAALTEPDDDTFRAVYARAAACYAPGSGLRPLMSRGTEPGGRADPADLEGEHGVVRQVIFAVGLIEDDAVALLGGPYDEVGIHIASAVLLRAIDGGWRVAGRGHRDPFAPLPALGASVGEPIDLEAVTLARIHAEPAAPADAVWLRAWAAQRSGGAAGRSSPAP